MISRRNILTSKKYVLLLALTYVNFKLINARPDADVMRDLTIGFGKALKECREEAKLSPEMMEEFHHIWQDGFQIIHREIGCAMICMAHKFELLTSDIRMHRDKMDEFVKSFPDGDKLADLMIDMIHTCEKTHDEVEDDCTRAVEITKCFKERAIKEGVAPTFEIMFDM